MRYFLLVSVVVSTVLYCHTILGIPLGLAEQRDERSGYGLHISRRLAEDPLHRILRLGGPLCREIVSGPLKATCDMPACGEFHLWRHDIHSVRAADPEASHPSSRRVLIEDAPPPPMRKMGLRSDVNASDLDFGIGRGKRLHASTSNSNTAHYRHRASSIDAHRHNDTKYWRNRFGYSSTNRKIVVSVGHNGFGNQLFQHYFGFRLAQYVHGQLFLSSLDLFSPSEPPPPNTESGASNIRLITDDAMEWDHLPSDHEAKRICGASNLTFSVRPKDYRVGRNHSKFIQDIADFMDPRAGGIQCIFLIGYFIDRNVCIEDARAIWPALVDPIPRLRTNFSLAMAAAAKEGAVADKKTKESAAATPKSFLVKVLPYHKQDMVVHMRCVVGHSAYTSNGVKFYETIFNNSIWRKLYVISPSTSCRGTYLIPQRYLLSLHNASLISSETNDYGSMDDFILMILAPRFVEDRVSTFSFWAGVFSNSSEVHVDVRTHGVVTNSTKFMYHDAWSDEYFGQYDASYLKSKKMTSVDGVKFPAKSEYNNSDTFRNRFFTYSNS